MHQYLLHEYLPGFANTVVSELGIALLFGLWSLRQLSMVVLVNFITHPALHIFLWAAFWWHSASAPVIVLVGLELVVVLAEGTMLWRWLKLRARTAFMIAAAMNATSCLLGFVISA